MRVSLRGLRGDECVAGMILLDKWLESRVGLLGMTFAVKKMELPKEVVKARKLVLYRVQDGARVGEGIDPAAFIKDALVDEGEYDVVVESGERAKVPNDPALGYDQDVGVSASPWVPGVRGRSACVASMGWERAPRREVRCGS